MKKVLIIITTGFVPYGGLTTVVMNYIRFMNMDDLQVDILSRNDPEQALLDEINAMGINYYKISCRNSHPFKYYKQLKAIAKNYDVVHVNSNSATAALELHAAKKAGVKKRIVHNHNSKTGHKFINALLKPFFKSSYTEAVACSYAAGDWLFGKGKFKILNNGIDAEKYRYNKDNSNKLRKEYGISEDGVVIGHVGKFVEAKNHSFLINAFNEYHKTNPNSFLMLVGDGVLRPEIETLITSLNLTNNVILTGMKKNINEHLSAMDIFAFPSLWEGMPLSLIEAQASGAICFGSDKIDRGVNLTGDVKFISIDNGVTPWVEAFKSATNNDRLSITETHVLKLREIGYDTSTNATELRNIYFN